MFKQIKELVAESNNVKELRNRYRPDLHKLGIGRIIGYVIFIMYFTLLPAALKKIWPILFTKFDGILFEI